MKSKLTLIVVLCGHRHDNGADVGVFWNPGRVHLLFEVGCIVVHVGDPNLNLGFSCAQFLKTETNDNMNISHNPQ